MLGYRNEGRSRYGASQGMMSPTSTLTETDGSGNRVELSRIKPSEDERTPDLGIQM
jgi:hypothetical protein